MVRRSTPSPIARKIHPGCIEQPPFPSRSLRAVLKEAGPRKQGPVRSAYFGTQTRPMASVVVDVMLSGDFPRGFINAD